jgi:hypothetical protein
MDVDGIPLGTDFVKRLTAEVASCDVLLAVIGPRWLDISDENGSRRLDNPNDFVRVEIGTALKRDIPVVPILLNGTKIPHADRLPPDLKDLAVRNGLDVRHASFHSDIGRLVRELSGISGTTHEGREPGTTNRPPPSVANTQGTRSQPQSSGPRQPAETEQPASQSLAKQILWWLIGTAIGLAISIVFAATMSIQLIPDDKQFGVVLIVVVGVALITTGWVIVRLSMPLASGIVACLLFWGWLGIMFLLIPVPSHRLPWIVVPVCIQMLFLIGRLRLSGNRLPDI